MYCFIIPDAHTNRISQCMLYWTALLEVVIYITWHSEQQLNAVEKARREHVKKFNPLDSS